MSSTGAAFAGVKNPVGIPVKKKSKRVWECADVIEINGIPPNVSAILMKAIRVAESFFKFHKDDIVPPQHTMKQNCVQHDVLGSIIERIEQVKELENAKAELDRSERLNRVVMNLLNVLNRGEVVMASAAVGTFNFLWKLQQNEVPIIRRVSLYLSGHLLMTNEQCLTRWLNDLLLWTSTVLQEQKFHGKDSKGNVLWQKEATIWAFQLADHFPGRNKIRVAALHLEQRGPSQEIESFDVSNNATDWRKIRDIAMKHADYQCRGVEKLIRRCYANIDKLVPRVIIDSTYQVTSRTGELLCGDDSDEDENIAWEEGDESIAAELHAASVEQTLALMQNIGSLSGGDLAIRLSITEETDNLSDGHLGVFKRRLEKYVHLLSNRHLPCLSSWLCAMTEADNLMEFNGSLVSMTQEDMQKRNSIFHHLFDLKQMISHVLAAASRLKIKAIKTNDTRDTSAVTKITEIPKRGLSQFLEQQRYTASFIAGRKRPNRIQVKFILKASARSGLPIPRQSATTIQIVPKFRLRQLPVTLETHHGQTQLTGGNPVTLNVMQSHQPHRGCPRDRSTERSHTHSRSRSASYDRSRGDYPTRATRSQSSQSTRPRQSHPNFAHTQQHVNVQCEACSTHGHKAETCRLLPKIASILDYVATQPVTTQDILQQFRRQQHPNQRKATKEKYLKVLHSVMDDPDRRNLTSDDIDEIANQLLDEEDTS